MGFISDKRTHSPGRCGLLPADLPQCLSMEWQIIEREASSPIIAMIGNI